MRSSVANLRILITGGAGYLGSKLVPELLADGHQVTVLDRLDHGGASLVPWVEYETLEIIPEDILTYSGAGRSWDVVLHLAALVGEPLCKLDPHETRRINVDGARRIHSLRAARHIMFSTCSNYGVKHPSELATEVSELTPTGVYSETKIAAEIEWLTNNGVVLRFGTAAGVSGRMRFDTLPNSFAHDAVLRQRIDVYQPSSWRPVVGMLDMVRYVSAIINPHIAVSGVYNIASFNATKKQMAEAVRALLPSIEVTEQSQTVDIRDYRVDTARVHGELGITPLCDLNTILQEVVLAVQLMHNPHDDVYTNVHAPYQIGMRTSHAR